MAKPNIEYKGKTYEFEGNLKLRRDYNKAMQKINEIDLSSIPASVLAKAQTLATGTNELNDEEALNIVKQSPEMMEYAMKQQVEAPEKMAKLNIETAFKMLGHTKLTSKDWEIIVEEIDNTYEEGANGFFASVVTFVFTQVVGEMKPLPTWK